MLKDQPSFPSRGFWVALLVGLAVFAFMIGPNVIYSMQKGGSRADMAYAVSNSKQIKLALDSFAMDNNGVYPNGETALKYGCPDDGSSNALFRQLFARGMTESEKIFWIKGSQLCSKSRPDDETTSGGVFDRGKTLEPGDNGWAYVMDQTNTDNPSRPLLFASPPRGAGLEFDPDLWDMKVVVLRIDGSAKPERLNPVNRLMDGDNKELLTTESAVWGEGVDEVQIAYPARAAKR